METKRKLSKKFGLALAVGSLSILTLGPALGFYMANEQFLPKEREADQVKESGLTEKVISKLPIESKIQPIYLADLKTCEIASLGISMTYDAKLWTCLQEVSPMTGVPTLEFTTGGGQRILVLDSLGADYEMRSFEKLLTQITVNGKVYEVRYTSISSGSTKGYGEIQLSSSKKIYILIDSTTDIDKSISTELKKIIDSFKFKPVVQPTVTSTPIVTQTPTPQYIKECVNKDLNIKLKYDSRLWVCQIDFDPMTGVANIVITTGGGQRILLTDSIGAGIDASQYKETLTSIRLKGKTFAVKYNSKTSASTKAMNEFVYGNDQRLFLLIDSTTTLDSGISAELKKIIDTIQVIK